MIWCLHVLYYVLGLTNLYHVSNYVLITLYLPNPRMNLILRFFSAHIPLRLLFFLISIHLPSSVFPTVSFLGSWYSLASIMMFKVSFCKFFCIRSWSPMFAILSLAEIWYSFDTIKTVSKLYQNTVYQICIKMGHFYCIKTVSKKSWVQFDTVWCCNFDINLIWFF